jgi:hypothetical protein
MYACIFSFQILAAVLLTAHLWLNVKAGIYPVTGHEAGNTYAYFNGPVATPAQPAILNPVGSVGGSAGGLGVSGVAVAPVGLSVDVNVSKIILRW